MACGDQVLVALVEVRHRGRFQCLGPLANRYAHTVLDLDQQGSQLTGPFLAGMLGDCLEFPKQVRSAQCVPAPVVEIAGQGIVHQGSLEIREDADRLYGFSASFTVDGVVGHRFVASRVQPPRLVEDAHARLVDAQNWRPRDRDLDRLRHFPHSARTGPLRQVERPPCRPQSEDIIEEIPRPPIRQQLVDLQVDHEALEPVAVLHSLPDTLREVACRTSPAVRTNDCHGLMLGHLV